MILSLVACRGGCVSTVVVSCTLHLRCEEEAETSVDQRDPLCNGTFSPGEKFHH